ncbi:hypothetical protein ACWC9U_17060 [Streptomyces sp. 900116325]
MTAAPFDPLRVVQNRLGGGNAGAFKKHDQVVVAAGAEYLVPAAAVHRRAAR